MTTSPKTFPLPKEPSWVEALNQPCPICDRRKGDHTVDEYVKCIQKRLEKLQHALQ